MPASGTDLALLNEGMTAAIAMVGDVITAIANQPVLAFFVGVSILAVIVGVIRRLRAAL